MLYFIMPANLPPEYYEAERIYKEAQGHREKVAALEALISSVPKHKGTDKLRADLRRRLSKLREEGKKSKKSGKGDLYSVEREGAAQAALMGLANAGKSSVLQCLTNANPAIADYPMSTVMPLSGMMPYEDIMIQLVDLPPIGFESTDGWVSGLIRNTDLVLIVVDLTEDPEAQAEMLLDQLEAWRIRKRVIIAANKSDSNVAAIEPDEVRGHTVFRISTATKEGLEELRTGIFRAADIVRVYSKEPGKEPDLRRPFSLPSGTTVQELAERIHKDFIKDMKFARVWGSVRIQGQKVQRDYMLSDRDIVEFHV